MFIHFNNANSPVQLPVVYPLQLWTRALYLNHVYSTQKLFSLSLPSLSPFPPSLFLSSLSLSLPPSHSLSLSLSSLSLWFSLSYYSGMYIDHYQIAET